MRRLRPPQPGGPRDSRGALRGRARAAKAASGAGRDMTAVIVAGAVANKPGSAGEAWVRMSWVRGLERLGLDVWFVEEIEDADESAVDWFRSVSARFLPEERAALIAGSETVAGPSLDELSEVAAESTLVNISGHLALPRLFDAFRRRVMVDIDPGFTQFWHAEGLPGARVDGHDVHFTIGELIGSPGCPVPASGVHWRHVRQPVVLDDWPVVEADGAHRFTTVGNWRPPFGPIEHGGRRYGLKVHEFRRFMELPARSPHEFELAVDIHPADDADREALMRLGWRLADPHRVAGDLDAFRAYVQESLAEFSVAQGIYVETACGWFSDRSVRYLASGRPVLVQDTGFSSSLPTGLGLVAFRTVDEAVAGADDIVARHAEHAAAARRIAEECFAAERVLGRFCEEAGIV